MKKVFQKNQMIIMTLAVVIAVAGYVNYSQKYESAGTKNGKTKTCLLYTSSAKTRRKNVSGSIPRQKKK